MSWRVEAVEATATEFHAREMPRDGFGRQVWIARPTGTALVLGSTQDDAIIDRAAAGRAGVEVVRRRSGGGVVLVVPGDLAWIDLVIGRDDPLWDDDVGTAMLWVGEAWSRALADLGTVTRVHRGPLVRRPWSDLVCFAGLGPGEVVGPGGEKVVGISQRRTRYGARFQTAALVHWEPDALVDMLVGPVPGPREVLHRMAFGSGHEPDGLEAALVENLPAD